MASIANSLKNTLRPHTRLIRFKYGANQSGMTSVFFLLLLEFFGLGSATQAAKETKPTPTGATSSPKATGKSTTVEFADLPKKYRRRPLTQDEIDLVTVNSIVFFIS